MEHSSRIRRQTSIKQNSSLRANQKKTKPKLPSTKMASKVQNETASPTITSPVEKPQSKKSNSSKPTKKQLISRKHIYNSKQITEIHDLKTGRSEYKAKAPIPYVMGEFNEILILGGNLLNVTPLSGNQYYTTEWTAVQDYGKQHQNLKTDTTMQNSQRLVQGRQKEQQFGRGSMIEDNLMSKSEDLHRRSKKKRVQRRSKSSEGLKRVDSCSQGAEYRCNQTRKGDRNQ